MPHDVTWQNPSRPFRRFSRRLCRSPSIVLLIRLVPVRQWVLSRPKRRRGRIETLFQELEVHLHSEINILAYPKAALFGFCVARVAYNVLAVVKAALRTVHGEETIDHDVSGYYLAGHIARTSEGMMIAVGVKQWVIFHAMPLTQFVEVLLQLAANVKLSKFRKHRRGPKKPRPKRDKHPNQLHVSTARLLAGK